MNFNPENAFKTLSISLHDSKKHISMAIIATRISAGNWHI